MTVRLRYENTCVVHSCLRPVREAGGYCWHHWAGLSPEQRAGLLWEQEHTQPTEPLDTLELLYALPSRPDPKRRAA